MQAFKKYLKIVFKKYGSICTHAILLSLQSLNHFQTASLLIDSLRIIIFLHYEHGPLSLYTMKTHITKANEGNFPEKNQFY